MSERRKGVCIRWACTYGLVRDKESNEILIAIPSDIPENEAGERRMWANEEIEFTPYTAPYLRTGKGTRIKAGQIEFITRVPWFPLKQVTGTVREWRGTWGFIDCEFGTYFCPGTAFGFDNSPDVGQSVVFDTALGNKNGKVRAINVRLCPKSSKVEALQTADSAA